MNHPAPAPLFLDCDTGIDDAMALAYLLAEPTVDLVGISTVSGNVSATQGALNTLDLLQLAGPADIPVAIGEQHPIVVGKYTGAVPHIHGRNGVGNVELRRATATPVAHSGPELLVQMARRHPGELRVLAIAPLTNLAKALELDAELPELVHSVTIMGGAIAVDGNVTPAAEANIWNDPEAANTVLAADWQVTLVPLDVTMQHVLTERERTQLLTSNDVFLTALGNILDLYFEFYAGKYNERLCALHDPLAAVIAANGIDTVGDLDDGSLSVVLAGSERGRTIRALEPRVRTARVVIATAEPVAPILMQKLAAWRDAELAIHANH